MQRYYTLVGHRKIPSNAFRNLVIIARYVNALGYIGRSGDAIGSDQALKVSGCPKAIHYLPNARYSGGQYIDATTLPMWPVANALIANVHPAWHRCNEYARLLHTRNAFEVLGDDLVTPSEFMILYAKPLKNAVKGGTNTAYQLARRWEIPTFNVYTLDVPTIIRGINEYHSKAISYRY